MKKSCTNCGVKKNEEEFLWCSRLKNKRRWTCRECERARVRAWYKKNKAYFQERAKVKTLGKRASNRVVLAVKRGQMVRGSCVVCGSEKADGHHPDHSKPLEVVWLCKTHHAEVHRKDNKSAAFFTALNEKKV